MGSILDEETRREHKRQNMLQSALLVAAVWLLLTIAGLLLLGPAGTIAMVAMLTGLFLLAPRIPPETVMRLYRGTLVARDQSQLSSLVDVLAWRAELPSRPALYVIPSMTLNAFATGTPENSAIAVTEGLLRRLTLREIAGVIAHEMSHIRNGDLEVMGLADMMTRLLQIMSYVALVLAGVNLVFALSGEQAVSWWAVLALYLAPALSSLMQLALSRAREFDADLEAAALTGDPVGLASALRRLESYTGHFWEDLMFPVPARRIPQPSVLRTHPETKDRIARLMSLGGQPVHEPLVITEAPMMSLVGYGPIEMRPRYRWPGLWF